MKVKNLLGSDCKSYHKQLSNLTDEERKLVCQATYSQMLIKLKNKLTEMKAILKGLSDGTIVLKGGKWVDIPYEETNTNMEIKLLPYSFDLEDSQICEDAGACADLRYTDIDVFVSENTWKKVLELESVNIENKIKEYTEKLNAL